MLCTATDLDGTPNRPSKSIAECVTKGPEATHANGWTPSEVFGHGLVNLKEAIKPRGIPAAAGGDARSIGALARNTRLAFSSAFGGKAAQRPFAFGAFDTFNRSYSFVAPVQTQMLAAPSLDDVMALNKGAVASHRQALNANVMHQASWSNSAASRIGDGQSFGIEGGRYDAEIGFAHNQRSSAVMPLGRSDGHDKHYQQTIWPKIAPQASDLASGNAAFDLNDHLSVGAHFNQGALQGANHRSDAYDFQDYAASMTAYNNKGGASLRFGRFAEDGHFLGAKAEGGYELAAGSGSSYVHLRAHRMIGDLRVEAHGTQIKTTVDFAHNSFVDDTHLNASEYGLGALRADVFATGDKVAISYKQPLAVTSGGITQHSVRGYTAAGDYRVVHDRLELAVDKRHEMLQLDYQVPLARDVRWFVSAATHRNWGNFGGRGNRMYLTGLNARF